MRGVGEQWVSAFQYKAKLSGTQELILRNRPARSGVVAERTTTYNDLMQAAIGIDVGGTGIKGAGVDVTTGEKLTQRYKVATPVGAHPDAVSAAVGAMVSNIRAELDGSDAPEGFDQDSATLPVGVTLPGVVRGGIMSTAANIDKAWIGMDAAALLSDATGVPTYVVNDADAAGIAESALGAAKGQSGATMVLTFGTGIGAAFIYDGQLIPNFELGHIDLYGHVDYEKYASPKNIERQGIPVAEWAVRVEKFVAHLELIMNPDRFVIGGSISKAADQYLPFASVDVPVVPARFRNNAGIVGAAWLAAQAAGPVRAS